MNKFSKADIHIHTTFSDGFFEPEELVDHAASHTDLKVMAITDHNTIAGAQAAHTYWQNNQTRFAGLELIKGIEVSSSGGHILGLFVEADIPQNMSLAATVQAIHDQGGLAIAPHPFTHLLSFTGMHGIGRLIKQASLDGVEVRSSAPSELYANVITAVYNRFFAKHAALGGSNSHHLITVGKAFTIFPGETATDFRQAVENRQVKAGGRVNSLTEVLQIMQQMVHRGERPLFLPNDRQHRHVQFGLTLDVTEAPKTQAAMIRCTGDLVAGNADLLANQGRCLLTAGISTLIIDLQDVVFMDSAGISSLVILQKRAQQLKGSVYLSNFTGNVMRGLQLVHFDKLFPDSQVPDTALSNMLTAVNGNAIQYSITG